MEKTKTGRYHIEVLKNRLDNNTWERVLPLKSDDKVWLMQKTRSKTRIKLIKNNHSGKITDMKKIIEEPYYREYILILTDKENTVKAIERSHSIEEIIDILNIEIKRDEVFLGEPIGQVPFEYIGKYIEDVGALDHTPSLKKLEKYGIKYSIKT